MCGLVGMAGFLETAKHRAVMKDLIYLDTLRGRDSTGLSCIKRNKDVLTRKFTCPGYDFIEMPVVDRAMEHGDQLWLAHNRFKTMGSVSKNNAHPFEVLDGDGFVMLVGAHNGTLNNKWEIERLLKNERFDTDSEALFNWLSENTDDYKKAIGAVKGAWSLVWWNPEENTLHLLRNEDRPMHYAWSKDHKVIIWASESWMLINAARRNGMELDQNERGLCCYATLPNTLYTLEIPQERDRVLPDFRREGGHTGAPVNTFQGQRRWNNWWGGEDDEEPAKKSKEGKKETGADGKKDGEAKVVTIGYPPDGHVGTVVEDGKIRGFQGRLLTLKEFFEIKNRGCGWCGDKLEPGSNKWAFLDDEVLVCHNCLHDKHPKAPVDEEYLDDDLPFHLGPAAADYVAQEDTTEYKTLIEAAAKGEAKKKVG